MKRASFDKEKLKEIKNNMRNTDQIINIQSVWDHGLSVAYNYKILIEELNNIVLNKQKKHDIYIPEALKNNAKMFLDKIIVSPQVMQKYLVYHDIGKPYCANKDEFG